MDPTTLTLIVAGTAWLVIGFGIALLLGRALRQPLPPPAPDAISAERLFEFMEQLSRDRVAESERFMAAMTEQLRVALVPPEPTAPVVTGRAFVERTATEGPSLEDFLDPTDHYMTEPPEPGRMMSADEVEPFGIPGLIAPPMDSVLGLQDFIDRFEAGDLPAPSSQPEWARHASR
jgi:hypothetical protein